MPPITDNPVVVTGVTGFIGSHTAIALLNEGYRVRGTLRSMRKADAIREVLAKHAPIEGLEFVEADLMDAQSWVAAVEGAEYVHHVASPLPVKEPKDVDEVIVPAREGTLSVLRASAAAGVKRVVVTSSVAAVGIGLPGDPSRTYTEADWTDPEHPSTSAYVKSKAIAERAAWNFVRDEAPHLELVSINPVYVIGPVLSADTSASVKIVSKALSGGIPAIPRISFGLVDVRDVASAHVAAMVVQEAAGERFIISTDTLWYADIIAALREHATSHARKLPRFRAPNLFLRLFAKFDVETRAVVGSLGIRRHFDNGHARKTLGWEPRTAPEAIRATADSLIALGLA